MIILHLDSTLGNICEAGRVLEGKHLDIPSVTGTMHAGTHAGLP